MTGRCRFSAQTPTGFRRCTLPAEPRHGLHQMARPPIAGGAGTDQLALADDPSTKRTGKVTTRKPPLRRGEFYYLTPDPSQPLTVLPYDSVTAALSEVAKSALVGWAAREAAKAALADPSLSVNEAANARYKSNEQAKLKGSTVHSWIEAYAQGATLIVDDVPEDIRGYLQAFQGWLGQTRPKILYSELTVFSQSLRYAGTLDAIIEDQAGQRGMIDWKTGKGVYEEAAYQMAAYRHAEYALDPKTQDVYTLPEIAYAQVIHLKADGTFGSYQQPDAFTEFAAYLHLFRVRSKRECPSACWCKAGAA